LIYCPVWGNSIKLISQKIYYPKMDVLEENIIFKYFDDNEIKIVFIDIEKELTNQT